VERRGPALALPVVALVARQVQDSVRVEWVQQQDLQVRAPVLLRALQRLALVARQVQDSVRVEWVQQQDLQVRAPVLLRALQRLALVLLGPQLPAVSALLQVLLARLKELAAERQG